MLAAVAFINLCSQKFTDFKHSLITQALAYFHKYHQVRFSFMLLDNKQLILFQQSDMSILDSLASLSKADLCFFSVIFSLEILLSWMSIVYAIPMVC